eukprot:SAG11_NODE_383_length_9899_cov_10.535510_7_plen_176_part_00
MRHRQGRPCIGTTTSALTTGDVNDAYHCAATLCASLRWQNGYSMMMIFMMDSVFVVAVVQLLLRAKVLLRTHGRGSSKCRTGSGGCLHATSYECIHTSVSRDCVLPHELSSCNVVHSTGLLHISYRLASTCAPAWSSKQPALPDRGRPKVPTRRGVDLVCLISGAAPHCTIDGAW